MSRKFFTGAGGEVVFAGWSGAMAGEGGPEEGRRRITNSHKARVNSH